MPAAVRMLLSNASTVAAQHLAAFLDIPYFIEIIELNDGIILSKFDCKSPGKDNTVSLTNRKYSHVINFRIAHAIAPRPRRPPHWFDDRPAFSAFGIICLLYAHFKYAFQHASMSPIIRRM